MTSDLLIRQARVLPDLMSPPVQLDVLIRAGRIEAMGPELATAASVPASIPSVDAGGAYLTPGWMDLHVQVGEPGHEYRETVATGCQAAAAGGFTAIACLPDTDPPMDRRDVVDFVMGRAAGLPVTVHPIGCVTRALAGEEMTEMAELVAGGAIAFSDGRHPIRSAGLLRRALEYAVMLDRVVISRAEVPELSEGGLMHEGVTGTRLGVPGLPSVAEEVAVARDIELAAYTGGALHVQALSSARSVALVRAAKEAGVAVTASVFVGHLVLTDEVVGTSEYDTTTKVYPPYRTAEDRAALWAGVQDGTIDVIASGHTPFARFETEVEYLYAPFGQAALESAWGLLGAHVIAPGHVRLERVLAALIEGPRRVGRLDLPRLEVGAEASCTLFDVDTAWTLAEAPRASLGHNTPHMKTPLRGRVHGIYNNGQWVPGW
ncbi:MAG: dihydroorotase [Bacteroidota bacterium]